MKPKKYIVLEFNLRKNVVCTFDVKKDIYKTSLSQFVQISLTDFHFGNQSSSYLQVWKSVDISISCPKNIPHDGKFCFYPLVRRRSESFMAKIVNVAKFSNAADYIGTPFSFARQLFCATLKCIVNLHFGNNTSVYLYDFAFELVNSKRPLNGS